LRRVNPALPAADIDSNLGEQDFGEWTGRTWDQLAVQAADLWKDPIATAPPRGESYAAMSARVQRCVIARARHLRRGNLIVVSHAGPIRAALALALELTPTASLRFEIDWLSVTRIESLVSDDGPAWRIREVGAKPR
jgi:alpha-ribazole phosphatase